MEKKILGGIIVVIAIAVLFTVQKIPVTQLDSQFILNSTTLNLGETLEVNITAKNVPIKKIDFQLGTEKRSVDCHNNYECLLHASLQPAIGVYNAKAIIETSSGEKKIHTMRITVTKQKSECVNGVRFDSCSEEKPLYCSNGILVKNCSICGCNEGFYCAEESCSPIAGKLELVQVNYPKEVLKDAKFRVSVIMKAEKTLRSGATYLVELSLGNLVRSETFTIGELAQTDSVKFEIRELSLQESVNDINLSVYALNIEKELLENFFEKNAVTVVSEAKTLEAPQITQFFLEGNDLIISWSKVENASEYKLYKSVDANPVFISYSLFQSFPAEQNSAVIQELEQGTHFFVMTADSEFANESGYSEVETIVVQG
ncbi:MAG TPA: hypothetical protein VFF13_05585 [archaeon]|nr:hypothetical protein [archaeon]